MDLGLVVDRKTGRRFMDEHAGRKIKSDALFKVIGTDENYPIAVCDDSIVKAINPSFVKLPLEMGTVKKFDTLKDLAAGYGIDYATLEKTNETFNGYMKAMKDPEFDCMFFKGASVNDKGPFYGVRLWPRVHHCMGGLEINEHAQVMSVRGTPIKGLYAAGEATGGVHGMVRLGTVAVADCMIFGRIAARDAFKKA